jgi:hypothetical protein
MNTALYCAVLTGFRSAQKTNNMHALFSHQLTAAGVVGSEADRWLLSILRTVTMYLHMRCSVRFMCVHIPWRKR